MAALCGSENVRQLVTHLHSRDSDAAVEMIDAAYWVKGCSSLGRLRYAVLLRVGKGRRTKMCLVDIKEATHAAAPRTPDTEDHALPADSAERVVMGARALAPALGDRMIAAKFLGKPVVVRELMPQDLKLEIDRLSQSQACKAARYLGNVVGVAHARQLDPPERRDWKERLRAQHSNRLDAPHWLWTSIVELVAAHERAYLNHCRQYALVPFGPAPAGQQSQAVPLDESAAPRLKRKEASSRTSP
jgi:uncharacterized protein (DUF2252 family)